MRKYFILFRSLPKSIYFNFFYFPPSMAIKLPVLIRRIHLKQMGGRIAIESKIKTGMIRIGFGDVAIIDRNKTRCIWHVSGSIVFKGTARLDHGTSISVGEEAKLNFGDNFNSTANCSIICKKRIDFGNNCLVSWDTLIMDTDFHKILNIKGEIINHDEEIKFGNRVWIGCRSTILKGTIISNDTILAAGTVVSKTFPESNIILGGNPAKIIKSGFNWDY